MPPPEKPTLAKLPVAPDFDQILNRVSLAVSKSQRLFSQAQHASATIAAPPPSVSTSSATSSTAPRSFSSLATASRPTQQEQSHAPPRYAYKTTAQLAAEDADFESARNLPPNAGLGYTAPGAGGSAAQAARKKEEEWALRRKLGLTRKGSDKTGGAKRGRINESESEEETGRSGLGRAKRARVGANGNGVHDGRRGESGGNADGLMANNKGSVREDEEESNAAVGVSSIDEQEDVETSPAISESGPRRFTDGESVTDNGHSKKKKKEEQEAEKLRRLTTIEIGARPLYMTSLENLSTKRLRSAI